MSDVAWAIIGILIVLTIFHCALLCFVRLVSFVTVLLICTVLFIHIWRATTFERNGIYWSLQLFVHFLIGVHVTHTFVHCIIMPLRHANGTKKDKDKDMHGVYQDTDSRSQATLFRTKTDTITHEKDIGQPRPYLDIQDIIDQHKLSNEEERGRFTSDKLQNMDEGEDKIHLRRFAFGKIFLTQIASIGYSTTYRLFSEFIEYFLTNVVEATDEETLQTSSNETLRNLLESTLAACFGAFCFYVYHSYAVDDKKNINSNDNTQSTTWCRTCMTVCTTGQDMSYIYADTLPMSQRSGRICASDNQDASRFQVQAMIEVCMDCLNMEREQLDLQNKKTIHVAYPRESQAFVHTSFKGNRFINSPPRPFESSLHPPRSEMSHLPRNLFL